MSIQSLKTTLQAFTLIELLVVISIIGILAALLLANFAGIRDRADDAKNKNNLKQVQTALRMSYNDSQTYPDLTDQDCSAAVLPANLNSADIPTTCKYSVGKILNVSNTDSFIACIQLNNVADGEKTTSQTKCNFSSYTFTGGLTVGNAYCVCSN